MRSTRRIVATLASFVLVTLMSSVAARPAKVKTPEVKADTKATFEVVSAEVRKQMAPGGRFEFVSSKEHAQIDASLDAMGALFDKYNSVAGMDQGAKIALFNDQEAVNAILKRRDSERLICKSELPTGSHIPTTKCRTYGDIQRAQTDSRNFMDRFQQQGQANGGNANGGGNLTPGTIGH